MDAVAPPRARLIALACAALVTGTTACASAPRRPPRPVYLTVEVTNDLAPPAGVEAFLYPVGGDDHDRIELGEVPQESTRQIDVTVPARGRYVLHARRLVPVPEVPFPVARPSATASWSSRHFTIGDETSRVAWRIGVGALRVEAGTGGAPRR